MEKCGRTATAMWKISSLCSPNSDHSNLSCIILLCVAQLVLARRFRKKSFILNARSLMFIFNRKLTARQLYYCDQNHCDEDKNLFESMVIGIPSYNTTSTDTVGTVIVVFTVGNRDFPKSPNTHHVHEAHA